VESECEKRIDEAYGNVEREFVNGEMPIKT
jgi:hypothetical protein